MKRTIMIQVSESDVLNLFTAPSVGLWMNRLHFQGIPADASIDRVFHDPICACFTFIVSHESFAITPNGCRPMAVEAKFGIIKAAP